MEISLSTQINLPFYLAAVYSLVFTRRSTNQETEKILAYQTMEPKQVSKFRGIGKENVAYTLDGFFLTIQMDQR